MAAYVMSYDGHHLSAPAQAQWLGHTGPKGPRCLWISYLELLLLFP